jgi:hypothetical protein
MTSNENRSMIFIHLSIVTSFEVIARRIQDLFEYMNVPIPDR